MATIADAVRACGTLHVMELTGSAAESRDVDTVGAVFDVDGVCVSGGDYIHPELPFDLHRVLRDNLVLLMVLWCCCPIRFFEASWRRISVGFA